MKRQSWILVLLLAVLWTATIPSIARAATYRTPNFVVEAVTSEIAATIGEAAERNRKELAELWLGVSLPKWYRKCDLKVRIANVGPGGSTTFSFDQGEVFGWRMYVQGNLREVLKSVLPHEINHTIFASYFRRPLPRWLDEGAAVSVERGSERTRMKTLLQRNLQAGVRYPLRKLFEFKAYPKNVLLLYAQGFSVVEFLLEDGGHRVFMQFTGHLLRHGPDSALKKFYAIRDAEHLEAKWLRWIYVVPEKKRRAEQGANAEVFRCNLCKLIKMYGKALSAPEIEQVLHEEGLVYEARGGSDGQSGY